VLLLIRSINKNKAIVKIIEPILSNGVLYLFKLSLVIAGVIDITIVKTTVCNIKITRQLNISNKNPEIVGPNVIPKPAVVPKNAKALVLFSPLNVLMSIVLPHENIAAPPTPAKPLAISSIIGLIEIEDNKEAIV